MISSLTDQPIQHETSINVVNVSVSQERAANLAKFVTEVSEASKGFWIKKEKDCQMVSYVRYPDIKNNHVTTAYADAMVIDVLNEEEYKLVHDYVKSRERIPHIIFFSDTDFSKQASSFLHSNAKWVKKSDTSAEKLRQMIIDYHNELNKIIKAVFDKFDVDKNGLIEKEELLKVSNELGENMSSEEFQQCFKVLDNKDSISFDKFAIWWKLGRQNTFAMSKLVQLELISLKYVDEKKLGGLAIELQNVKDIEDITSKHHLKFYSTHLVENPGLQALIHVVKGEERLEYVKNHLIRFSDSSKAENSRWLDITLEFDTSVSKEDALEKVKNHIDKFFLVLEDFEIEVSDMFNSFFNMEETLGSKENIVIIRLRQKADTQKYIDQLFSPLIHILGLIPGNQQMMVDFRSGIPLKEAFGKNMTVKDFLSNYSLEIKMDLVRDLTKLFGLSSIATFLTAPHDLQINCRMNLENLIPCDFKDKLDLPLSTGKSFIDQMLTGFMGENSIMRNLNTVELHLNAFDLFASVKVYAPEIFN